MKVAQYRKINFYKSLGWQALSNQDLIHRLQLPLGTLGFENGRFLMMLVFGRFEDETHFFLDGETIVSYHERRDHVRKNSTFFGGRLAGGPEADTSIHTSSVDKMDPDTCRYRTIYRRLPNEPYSGKYPGQLQTWHETWIDNKLISVTAE